MAKRPVLPSIGPKYAAFLRGEIKVEDLDYEELMRGQLRNSAGTFSGTPPQVIPREFHTAVVRELQFRMNAQFREHGQEAVSTIVEIMRDGEHAVHSKGRLDAAKYIVERIIGKIPDKMEVSGEVTIWQQAVEGGELLVDVGEDIEDAEILPDETPVRRRPVRRKAISE